MSNITKFNSSYISNGYTECLLAMGLIDPIIAMVIMMCLDCACIGFNGSYNSNGYNNVLGLCLHWV